MLTAFVPFVTVSATKDTAIAVPEGETLIFSEDFNVPSGDSRSIADYMQANYPRGDRQSGNTGAFLSFWGGSGWSGVDYHDFDNTLTYAECNSQKKYAVPMCTSASGQADRTFTIYLPTTNKPSTGVARVRMNIGFSKNSTYLTRCNVIAFENESRDSGSTIMNISNVNTLESNDGNTSAGGYAISTWYDFDFSVDLDNDYYWFRMTEHDTGIVAFRNEGVFDKSTFGGINFALSKSNTSESWGNCAPRIDNLLVTTVNDSTASYLGDGEDYIFRQDFENFYCVQKDADPVAAPPKFTTHFGYVVSDGLYNGSKSLVGSQDHKQMAVNLSVGAVRTEGAYSLRYKFYPAAKNNALYIAPSQAAYGRPWQRESGHAYFSLSDFDSNRRWFDVEVIVDLDSNSAIFTAYEDGTSTVFYTAAQAYSYNLGVFDFSQDNDEASGTHCYFGPSLKLDDVVFKKYKEAPIRISGEATLYSNTFEAVAGGEGWYDNDALTGGGFRSWNDYGILSGYNSDRAFSPVFGMGQSGRSLEWYRPDADGTSGPTQDGIYHIRFNYKPGSYATVNNYIKLYSYNSTQSSNKKLSGSSITALATATLNGFGNIWTTVDIVLSEGDKALVNVTNASTGANLYSQTVDASTITKFYAMEFKTEGASTAWTLDNSPAIDNFYVGVGWNSQDLQTTIVSDDFDSYTDISSWYADTNKTAGGFRSWNDDTVDDPYGGKAISFGYGYKNQTRSFEYYVGSNNTKETSGQILISFDWRGGTQVTNNYIYVGQDEYKDNGNYRIQPIANTTLNGLTAGEWYTVNIMVDLAMKKYDYRILSVEDNDAAVVSSGSGDYNFPNVGFISCECRKGDSSTTWTADGSSGIDNFHMAKMRNLVTLSVSQSGSTITANANVKNFMLETAKPSVVIIGQYDSSNQLVKVDFATQSDTSAKTISGSAKSASTTEAGTATTVKAFIWNDLTNNKALRTSATLE